MGQNYHKRGLLLGWTAARERVDPQKQLWIHIGFM